MNKKYICIGLLLLFLMMPIVVNAAGIDINLKSDTQEYKITNSSRTFDIYIQLEEFVNIENGIPLGCSAILDYDTSLIEDVEIIGQNGWNVSYNKSNSKLICDTDNAIPKTQIAKITLKARQGKIVSKENCNIMLKNIELSDGSFKIEMQKNINVKLINGERTDVELPQKVDDIEIIAGEMAINNKSQNPNIELPNAGNSSILIILIIVAIVLMIIFKFKAKDIKY